MADSHGIHNRPLEQPLEDVSEDEAQAREGTARPSDEPGFLVSLDRSRLVEDERALVAAGIHSRRRAADELGVEDPELEFRRWLEERQLSGESA